MLSLPPSTVHSARSQPRCPRPTVHAEPPEVSFEAQSGEEAAQSPDSEQGDPSPPLPPAPLGAQSLCGCSRKLTCSPLPGSHLKVSPFITRA